MEKTKNADGSKGKICNNCGGYGYTNGVRKTIDCQDCDKTGIARKDYLELVQELMELRSKLLGIDNGSNDS